MNKFLITASVLLLGLSGYLGYQVIQLRNSQTTAGGACPMAYDYSKGDFEGIINYETAELLHKTYNNSKRGIPEYKNGILTGGEDSKNIWFSLERLKNFIWNIENKYCGKGCTDSLGLRIYFGRYPNLAEHKDGSELGLDNVPKEYSNRLTLFMVPTYKDKASGYYYDFYPGADNCRAEFKLSPTHSTGGDLNLTLHDISPYIFLFDVSGPTEQSQNHGGLIPPGASTGCSFN